MQKIMQGNLNELAPKHKGWFIGHFMEEAPFRNNEFEVKWSKFKRGDEKPFWGTQKIAQTIGILIYGRIEMIFSKEDKKITLQSEGDFVYYDAGVTHSWRAIEDTLLISLRWPSLPHDQPQERK